MFKFILYILRKSCFFFLNLLFYHLYFIDVHVFIYASLKDKIIFLSYCVSCFVYSVLLGLFLLRRFNNIFPYMYLSEQTRLVLVSSAVFQWLITWPTVRFHSTSWCTQSFPVPMCLSRTSGNKQQLALSTNG